MSNKISAWTASTNPPGVADILPIVQSSANRRTTLGALFNQLLGYIPPGTGLSPVSFQTQVAKIEFFESIAAMKAYSGPTTKTVAMVRGYYAAGDGGGGIYYYDSSSSATSNGGTIVIPTAAPASGRWLRQPDYYQYSFKVFGAKGDGTTVDTAAIQATLAAMTTGGFAIAPPGVYVVDDALAPVNGTHIIGMGRNNSATATAFKFTAATKTFLRIGTSGTAVNYGGGIRDCYVILTAIDSVAIELYATVQASVFNVGIEGAYSNFATRTNVGLRIRGGTSASSFFNSVENVEALHCHIGLSLPATGGGSTQQYISNFSATSDASAGDTTGYGINIQGGGQDSLILGGDMEDNARGIYCESTATNVKFYGTRFESNTIDIKLDGGVTGMSFLGSRTLDAAKISDGSGLTTNVFEVGVAGTIATSNVVCAANQIIGQATKGTFTATGTGFTAVITATFSYTITDNLVVVDITLINGTSNATSFTITGFPTVIRPRSGSKGVAVVVLDNGGAAHAGIGSLDTAGVLTLSNTLDSGGLFTNAGTKQLKACSISYTVT